MGKFLAELPVFTAPHEGYQIDYASLRTYGDIYGTNAEGEASANMPRREELFRPPLVIVPKAPGEDQFGVQAYLADQPVAFSKAYYGYSCTGLEEEALLAALIFLIMHSTAFRYFSLMCSSSLGVDRMILTKGDIDNFPFPDHRKLPAKTKAMIQSLALRLQHDVRKPWAEMNEFIFHLYGIDEDAVQVAEDTLFAAASYRKAGKAALDRTIPDTRAVSCVRCVMNWSHISISAANTSLCAKRNSSWIPGASRGSFSPCLVRPTRCQSIPA